MSSMGVIVIFDNNIVSTFINKADHDIYDNEILLHIIEKRWYFRAKRTELGDLLKSCLFTCEEIITNINTHYRNIKF
jgi:hypothetical protein